MDDSESLKASLKFDFTRIRLIGKILIFIIPEFWQHIKICLDFVNKNNIYENTLSRVR